MVSASPALCSSPHVKEKLDFGTVQQAPSVPLDTDLTLQSHSTHRWSRSVVLPSFETNTRRVHHHTLLARGRITLTGLESFAFASTVLTSLDFDSRNRASCHLVGFVHLASSSVTREYGNCLLLSQISLHLDLPDLHNMVGRCRSISPDLLRCT